ncbi:MAG TPA: hypothetical protein PLP62_03895 [Flavobacteriaceae bacterium]|nr:hypothetical protein [Flavobacteriaceae bacterium]MCB9212504.1 hypothetical protein [Alteromonas sp.]HPF10567.1 hypothetical protein [Flavobacteriaceae bacterium]HQU64333.1 hypothetical protein [Flavobacteriaceae bacterium]HRW43318.1 hypothetical protein [Flavobacteriaceae bacterium]
MWVSQKNKWHSSTTAFERFFIEKMIQKCDFDECISNRHRTTNGFVQVKEMINLIRLSEIRGRSIKTLLVLGKEAKSEFFSQNIISDCIINKYFLDLKKFIIAFDFDALISNSEPNYFKLQEFKNRLLLFSIQLDKHYLACLLREFNNLNFDDEKFEREARHIERLIDIYISYLIFCGYSASSITSFLSDELSKGNHLTFEKFTLFFNFSIKKFRHYLVIEDINDDITDFAALLDTDYTIEVCQSGENPNIDKQLKKEIYLRFSNQSIDVNSFIRELYDKLLKKLVVKRDRQSLNSFNSFFELAYWSHGHSNKLKKSELLGDPINVKKRERTLLKTLEKLNVIEKAEKNELPEIRSYKIYNAVYYYNLALGSKSIENSLALMWTALEASLPYRTAFSDVECVRNLISKILSLGGLSRDIMSISRRFKMSNKLNKTLLTGAGLSKLDIPSSDDDLYKWAEWLKENKKKRFEKVVNTSDMLAFEYSKLGQLLADGTARDLLQRVLSSRDSLDFQIQRIYVHRNQIIHSGDFINEYTNLWMNIEWYTGKFLAFLIYNEQREMSYVDAVRNLESDFEYLVSYLQKNKQKTIQDLPSRIKEIIFSQYWQAF